MEIRAISHIQYMQQTLMNGVVARASHCLVRTSAVSHRICWEVVFSKAFKTEKSLASCCTCRRKRMRRGEEANEEEEEEEQALPWPFFLRAFGDRSNYSW